MTELQVPVCRILRASVSRAAVLRRSERTCCSSASADEVGGFRARCASRETKKIGLE
jgi:hypothetical protein